MPNSFITPRRENGYALLLSILVLSTMLTIGLTVTSVITTQVRLTRRVFDAMKALAAADSGIERGLYEDYIVPPGVWGPSVPNSSIGPINIGSGSYTVEKCPADVIPPPCGGPSDSTVLRSIGRYGGSQRSIEVNY